MIKVAILGAGTIGNVMARTIKAMNSNGDNTVQLYAVAARDISRAEEFAQRYGIEKSYGSYQDLYEDPNVQLVYIATPHNFHFEQAKACLLHGKNVLCEKPFTVNSKEAQELFALAAQRKLLITEAIWTRYQPMRQIINETIKSGVIGSPKFLTANLSYMMMRKERLIRPELAGGALLDVGIYPLNFALMIFGHPESIDGSCILSDAGVDIADSITLMWPSSERMATLATAATVVSDRYGIVQGTSGFMMVENINNPQSIQIFDKEYVYRH